MRARPNGEGLVMRVLAADKQRTILHLLIEGNSIRSTERLTRVHRDTIMRLLVKAGEASHALLDQRMKGLKLKHLELDEIWTFVDTKQAHIKPERVGDTSIGDQFLFVAFDEDTKLIPTFAIGKRTTEVTEAFALDLASRVIHQEGVHIPQISTDGFAAYPGAIDLAFAREASYGVLIKDYTESEQPGRYGPPDMVHADRRPQWGIDDPYSICTSHVERNNLTIRTFLRRFTRLSLGFSKKLENLCAAVALHFAHFNFCRRHGSLRMTPAMSANVVGEMWSLDRLMREIGM
jgi:IS1 family transposase